MRMSEWLRGELTSLGCPVVQIIEGQGHPVVWAESPRVERLLRPLLDTLPKGAMRMPGPAFLSGPGASLPEAYQGWKWYFRLRAASAFSLPELERLHGRALDLDLSLKSSPASPVLLFSRLLHSACIPGAA